MTAPAEELGVGSIIAGKYQIDELVGEGGMGVVWKATQLDLDRPVAIKVVRHELTQNEEVVTRTLLEAKAAARLRGEHIVRVLDVGRLGTGAPYIVMELLQGHDVYTELAQRILPMPITEAVDLVLEACEGLAEAHSRGVVHRDLKPENLFLAEQPDGRMVLKILDFGVCKAARSEADPALTSPAAAVGSPQYMAPEQMRGGDAVDARADIWSLGATLYELVAGICPFQAATIPALCSMVLEKEPVRPRYLRPDLPPPLEGIIDRCLKKKPDERFGNVDELARALLPYGSASAPDRVERITRVISGVQARPTLGSDPALLTSLSSLTGRPGRVRTSRTSRLSLLQQGTDKTLNSLEGSVAPLSSGREGTILPRRRWLSIAAISIALGMALPLVAGFALRFLPDSGDGKGGAPAPRALAGKALTLAEARDARAARDAHAQEQPGAASRGTAPLPVSAGAAPRAEGATHEPGAQEGEREHEGDHETRRSSPRPRAWWLTRRPASKPSAHEPGAHEPGAHEPGAHEPGASEPMAALTPPPSPQPLPVSVGAREAAPESPPEPDAWDPSRSWDPASFGGRR